MKNIYKPTKAKMLAVIIIVAMSVTVLDSCASSHKGRTAHRKVNSLESMVKR